MRKTTVRLMIAGSAMTALVALGSEPAQAQGNPTFKDNPFASVDAGQGSSCVWTYRAPPAEGGALFAPRSSAAGGNPGWDSHGTHGTCTQ